MGHHLLPTCLRQMFRQRINLHWYVKCHYLEKVKRLYRSMFLASSKCATCASINSHPTTTTTTTNGCRSSTFFAHNSNFYTANSHDFNNPKWSNPFTDSQPSFPNVSPPNTISLASYSPPTPPPSSSTIYC